MFLQIDRRGRESLGGQVQRQLRDAIRSGRLRFGERLPSTRALASQLGLSRGVIVDAYAQLESEGYLAPRVGSGTEVASRLGPTSAPAVASDVAPPVAACLAVDFEYGIPDLASFPMRDWSWALGVAARTARLDDLGDELGAGNERLRAVVAAYLRRVRGSSVGAAEVVISPGFRHGLNIVLRALAVRGVSCVALEDPGPVDHDAIVGRCGLTPVRVPVDGDGLNVDILASTHARAVVVTPAHQSPTGVALSAERRLALVEWARRSDGYVIEDDYDTEFRYDRQPVGALQGLAPDRVVGMGSVSKTLAPMLRLGWIACPTSILAVTLREKALIGRGAPALDQLALAALIESGRFDKHLRHVRAVYGRRRRRLVEAVAAHAPQAHVEGLAAGCHAVIRLPPGYDEATVVDACAERGVGIYGMSRYRSHAGADPVQLVVGFGNVSEAAIERGVTVLGEVLRIG